MATQNITYGAMAGRARTCNELEAVAATLATQRSLTLVRLIKRIELLKIKSFLIKSEIFELAQRRVHKAPASLHSWSRGSPITACYSPLTAHYTLQVPDTKAGSVTYDKRQTTPRLPKKTTLNLATYPTQATAPFQRSIALP